MQKLGYVNLSGYRLLEQVTLRILRRSAQVLPAYMLKSSTRSRLAFFVFLGVIACFSGGCQGIPPYDKESQEELAIMGENFGYFTHVENDQRLKGVRGGTPHKPPVLFIHGTPGDWKAWGRYLGDSELQEKTFMLAVDRPGFGESDSGNPVLSLETQASVIMQSALNEHPGPFVVVGHSYGGAIQLEMAANFPDKISSLIILAGAIDPNLHEARWYHHLANTCLGRCVLPEPLNVATQEMLSLPTELKRMKVKLKEIQIPITVIQGGKDWLAPSGNAAYAQEALTAAEVKVIPLPKQGHFLPWKEYDLVKGEILKNIH